MKGDDAGYWLRQGAKIRSIANDIKRNDEALAVELEEELATIHAAFTGTATPKVVDRIINKMLDIYPLSRLDLDVRRDDTDEGVIVQTAERAQASRRFMARSNSLGQPTPYYEYRDAAMSAVGPYRPEWIKELRTVTTDDPTDPDVAYNSGHLMHQVTFFVGPVNFYWKAGDQSFLEQMDTGDSYYITPFVPHSFTSRDATRDAYIVAVTFNGKLDSTQQEIAVLDPEGVERSLLDLSDPQKAFPGILGRELANAMLGIEELGDRAGIPAGRLSDFIGGLAFPDPQQLSAIAEALGVNLRDLLPPEATVPEEVVVKRRSPQSRWRFPSEELPRYEVESLAGSRKVPFMKALAVRTLSSEGVASDDFDLVTPSHEFCYNYGAAPAVLTWQGPGGIRREALEPGGSYYAKPMVPHSLRSGTDGKNPELVVVRLGGSLYGDGHLELSALPRVALSRVFLETQQWYSPTRN